MSPRTRGFNDVPSPHDSTGPRNRGDKPRPYGAPPPRRSELGPPSEPAHRGSPALPLVAAIVAIGVLIAVIAAFVQRQSPPPTQPTGTHTVIEVPQ